MAGVIFSHPNSFVGSITLRLPPTQVDWEYNLNVAKTPTHGGEVVQLLSMNFNRLILEGKFGIEGPHGLDVGKKDIVERTKLEFFDLNKGRGSSPAQPYQIGLTQMTEYFRRYFNIAAQGGQVTTQGNLIRANHDQQPMTIQYQTDIESVMRRWTGYPVDFPSYKRNNEEFSPLWHVEFEVEEPDALVVKSGMPAELRRLRAAVGYEAFNPFSDPIGAGLENKDLSGIDPKKSLDFAKTQAQKQATKGFDELSAIVSTNPTDVLGLLQQGASRPITSYNDPTNASPNPTPTKNKL
jgi:hypothetical protein